MKVMRIEIMENQKIKVSLTVNDLMFYNLKPETLSPDSPELNKFLFHVMEDVKKQTGFNPYSGQVIVEAVRSDNGINLYITRLSENTKTRKPNTKRIKAVSAKRKTGVSAGGTYLFTDFDDLCRALRLMTENNVRLSSLYKFEGNWYLVTNSGDVKLHCMLSEYCNVMGGMLYTDTFLKEHGEVIGTGKQLLEMTEGVKKLYEGEEI